MIIALWLNGSVIDPKMHKLEKWNHETFEEWGRGLLKVMWIIGANNMSEKYINLRFAKAYENGYEWMGEENLCRSVDEYWNWFS